MAELADHHEEPSRNRRGATGHRDESPHTTRVFGPGEVNRGLTAQQEREVREPERIGGILPARGKAGFALPPGLQSEQREPDRETHDRESDRSEGCNLHYAPDVGRSPADPVAQVDQQASVQGEKERLPTQESAA